MSKLKTFLITGGHEAGTPIDQLVMLDAFGSNGDGKRQLEEAKHAHGMKYRAIRLYKLVG